MSLSPVKSTVSAVAPVFAKVLELFTGGFSITTTGFNTDVILPAGSLLKVDEAARTAVPIKTATITQTTNTATGVSKTYYFASGHHFKVNDYMGFGTTRPQKITAVAATTASGDKITATGGTAATAATSTVVFQASTGIGTTAVIKTVPNALSAFETTIETGGFVAALLRGTAYKNRIQKHVAGHLADINLVHISESY